MDQYLGDNNGGDDEKLYYKLANLDDRIKNADQVGIRVDLADHST